MFDFSPDGFNPSMFFVRLGMVWAGYLLFLGVAIYLGRRLGDWRIPVLAAAGLLLPELTREMIGPRTGRSLEVWTLISGGLQAGEWLLYAAVIMRSAKLVRRANVRTTA